MPVWHLLKYIRCVILFKRFVLDVYVKVNVEVIDDGEHFGFGL